MIGFAIALATIEQDAHVVWDYSANQGRGEPYDLYWPLVLGYALFGAAVCGAAVFIRQLLRP